MTAHANFDDHTTVWPVDRPASPAPVSPRLTAPEVPPRFRILRELGRGGMAVVYHAYDVVSAREVALKFIGQSDDLDAIKRFRREATDLAALYHPHIVDFYSVGESQGREFIEMEYVGGGTLKTYLESCHSLSQLLNVFAQICDGLEHIHQCGMVHRDIKPINILMTPDGCPKISDLGLARRASGRSDLTELGVVMGTAAYLAPEQVMAHTVGPAADLYALGVTMFEAVTGQHPFPGEGPLALIRAHLEQKAPRASELLPGLPPELDSLLSDLLEKDPLCRPSSAAEVRSRLQSCLAHVQEPQEGLTAASPQAMLERARRHLDGHRPEEALSLLERLSCSRKDPHTGAEILYQRARALDQQRSPEAPRVAWDAVAACRSLGSPRLGSALLLLGRAAIRVGADGEALKALLEARAVIPSSAQDQQIALMELLAELHERGSLTGISLGEAARYREIAAGLRQRRKGSGGTTYQVVFSEAAEPKPLLPRLLFATAVACFCLAIGMALIGGQQAQKTAVKPADDLDAVAARMRSDLAEMLPPAGAQTSSGLPASKQAPRVSAKSESPSAEPWPPESLEPIVVRVPVKVIQEPVYEPGELVEEERPARPRVVKAKLRLPEPDYQLAAPRQPAQARESQVQPIPSQVESKDPATRAIRVRYGEPDLSDVHPRVRQAIKERLLRQRGRTQFSEGVSQQLFGPAGAKT